VVPVVIGREVADRMRSAESGGGGGGAVDGREFTVGMFDREGYAAEARNDLDMAMCRISKEYLKLNESGSLNFPPSLVPAAKKLHGFRRGTIIGPLVQSSDEMAVRRDLFLRLPLDDCLRYLAPEMRMFRSNRDGTVEEVDVPPETLALRDDCTIAADAHDTTFLWHGKSSPPMLLTHPNPSEWLHTRSSHRFPAADHHTFTEGDSMQRRFVAHLAPSHGDTCDTPSFSNLSVKAKFTIYDPKVDSSYNYWMATNLPPPPPPPSPPPTH